MESSKFNKLLNSVLANFLKKESIDMPPESSWHDPEEFGLKPVKPKRKKKRRVRVKKANSNMRAYISLYDDYNKEDLAAGWFDILRYKNSADFEDSVIKSFEEYVGRNLEDWEYLYVKDVQGFGDAAKAIKDYTPLDVVYVLAKELSYFSQENKRKAFEAFIAYKSGLKDIQSTDQVYKLSEEFYREYVTSIPANSKDPIRDVVFKLIPIDNKEILEDPELRESINIDKLEDRLYSFFPEEEINKIDTVYGGDVLAYIEDNLNNPLLKHVMLYNYIDYNKIYEDKGLVFLTDSEGNYHFFYDL